MPRPWSDNAERAQKFYKGGKDIFALEKEYNFGLDLLYSASERPPFIVAEDSTQGSKIRPQLQYEREFSISFSEGSILREQFGLCLKAREGEYGFFYLDVMDTPLIVWDDSMSHIRFTQTELSSLHNELEDYQKRLATLENLKNGERRDTESIDFCNREINEKCEEIRNFLTMEYKRITQKEIVLPERADVDYGLKMLKMFERCIFLGTLDFALTVDEYQDIVSRISEWTWVPDARKLKQGMSLLAQIKYAGTLPEDIIENYRKALLQASSDQNVDAVLEAIVSQYKWHSYTQYWPHIRQCRDELRTKYHNYYCAIVNKDTVNRANLLQEAAAFNDRCMCFNRTFNKFSAMFWLDSSVDDPLIDYSNRFAEAPNDNGVINEMENILSVVGDLFTEIKSVGVLDKTIIERYRNAILQAGSDKNLDDVLAAIVSQYKWHSYTQHLPHISKCKSELLDKFNKYQNAIFDKDTPDRAKFLQDAVAFNDRCIRFNKTFHEFCAMFRLDPPAEDPFVDDYLTRFASESNEQNVIDEMKQMLSEVALNGRTAGYVGAFRNEIKRLKGYVAAYDAHKKAEEIEKAIRDVPLKDRVRMFTHAYSDECAAVRKALAQRRYSKESETLFYRASNGFPMCLNPAQAYINVEKEISKYSDVFRSNANKDSLPGGNNLNDRVKEAYNLFYTLPNVTTTHVIDASYWERLYVLGSVPVKEKCTYCLGGGVIYFVEPMPHTKNDTNEESYFHAINEFGEPCTMEVRERKGGGRTFIIKDPVSDDVCQQALRDLRLLRIHVGKEPLLSDDEYTTCLDHLKVKSNSQENYIIALCEFVGQNLRSIGYVCGRQCQHERDAVCTVYKNKILAWINGGQALSSKTALEIQFDTLISIFKKYTEFHKIMNETLGENYQIFAKDSAWLEDFSRCDTKDGLAQLVKNANRLEEFQKKVVVFKCRWSGDHDTVVRNCIENMPSALQDDESWDSFIKEMESRPSNGTDQIEVVRGEIARLYKQNSVSAHKKAKAIDAALGKVPLADRANVLTRDTPECRAVQHVLAAKRPWFSMFEEPKDSAGAAPDVAKAATAYKNAMNRLNGNGK